MTKQKIKKQQEGLDELIKQERPVPYDQSQVQHHSISDAISEREKLKNKALALDIRLKKYTLVSLFIFLGLESMMIFLLAYLQATHTFRFALEEWSFKLLVTATIGQITLMIQVAVKHLFPLQESSSSHS